MSQFTDKADVITGGSSGIGIAATREPMNSLINMLIHCCPVNTRIDSIG
jgi:short-subunit dehydrogenase involved in D-alanine esterification of teichoic acids